LTGIAAAAAGIEAIRAGGGVLIDANLHASAALVAGASAMQGPWHRPAPVTCTAGRWRVEVANRLRVPVRAPRARPHAGRARTFGADTQSVLRELT
jgi:hypothetical protein